ncbi:ATP-binding protein [Pirellula sp. SH-Sr6A]|uniref:ATP-binding protein n=1 Tax=Pirellula sp. SH-Sr6A TaxID=1632865 RepID=UPI001F0B49F7|nr:ATP-binding protein [Pirellula sp. SH-Sr6A]
MPRRTPTREKIKLCVVCAHLDRWRRFGRSKFECDVSESASGKTMLAKRLPTNLPTLSASESIETIHTHSTLRRRRTRQELMAQRTFRSPHHKISDAWLVGGGRSLPPDEAS